MRNTPQSSRAGRRYALLAGAATATGLLGSTAARGAFTYTNVDAAAATTAGIATYTSRGLSINDSSEVEGFYQTTSFASSRVYFTYNPGSSGITPYASGLTYPTAGSNGGAAIGQLLNANGTYLAVSGTAGTGTGSGGFYNPSATTPAFTPVPLNGTYNGSFAYTGSNGTAYTQTQTASQIVPIAINSGGSIVGNQIYTPSGGPANVTSVTHGMIYNGTTTIDIGGNPAGITYTTGFIAGASPAVQNAVGNSSLVGISSNNAGVTVLVGSQGNAISNFNGTPTDAIYGTLTTAGTTSFSDLASLISTLVPSGDAYNGSNAAAVSENGRYVVGSYQYTVGTGTTKYTHAFELTNDTTIADLGFLSANNNAYTNVLDAESVNDSGTVVGYGYLNSTTIHAFEYTGGQLTDLNSVAPTPVSSGVYTEAFGVDDSGDITGYTVVPTASGSTTSSIGNAAFLLTSVPEPTSASLAFVAGGLLLGRRRRAVATA